MGYRRGSVAKREVMGPVYQKAIDEALVKWNHIVGGLEAGMSVTKLLTTECALCTYHEDHFSDYEGDYCYCILDRDGHTASGNCHLYYDNTLRALDRGNKVSALYWATKLRDLIASYKKEA
jgi:hypothetical protein